MFVLVRAVTYAALFIGFVLVYLPGRFLSWSGIVAPATTGAPQVPGMIMVTIGTAIALWCVFTFVFIGEGTPAPFKALWYTNADDAVEYATCFSRSHDAMIRVYDDAGNVIQTHEHKGDFKEW
jgi:hypothetical protein